MGLREQHGHFGTPTYRAWAKMWERCRNPKARGYAHYGGAGVGVCPAWERFSQFLVDMGEKPSGLTLDRIDNNKGYEPGNCRWATRKTQAINRKHVKVYTFHDGSYTLAEWAAITGVPRTTLYRWVVDKGVPFQQAILTLLTERAASWR